MAAKTTTTKSPPTVNQPPTPPRVGILNEIAVDDVDPWDGNPRRAIDPTELAELTDSVRDFGVISPITVRPHPTKKTRWLIIAGERRWRAAAAAGLEFVPAIVHEDIDDVTALEMAVAENLKRVGINPLEEAEALWRLAEAGHSQSAIAARLGLSQPWVANRMRLRLLSEPTKELLESGKLSAAHGIALATYQGLPLESWLAKRAVAQEMSTHDLEREKINKLLYQTPSDVATHLTEGDVGAEQFAICKKKCPFNAYRYANGTSHCLYPAHRQELVDARQKAAAAHRDTEIATATAATGQPPASLITADRAKFTQVYNPPSGCTETCPCRTRALGHGGQIVDACSDPKRLNRLRDEDQAVQIEQSRARYAARLQRVDAWVGRGMAHDTEIIALLLVDRCTGIDEHLQAVTDELGLVDIKWRMERGYGAHPDLLAQLGKLDKNTLLEIAGRATLRGNSPAAEQWAKLHPAPKETTA